MELYRLGTVPGGCHSAAEPLLPGPHRGASGGGGAPEPHRSYGGLRLAHVGKVGRLYAIYRCDDPEAPALYSDPESLALAMKKMMRWMWVGLLFWIIWVAVIFWDEWPLLFHYPAEFARELILRAEVLIPIYGVMLALAILAVSWGIGTFLASGGSGASCGGERGPRRGPGAIRSGGISASAASSPLFLCSTWGRC